jgi:hypothetical protein
MSTHDRLRSSQHVSRYGYVHRVPRISVCDVGSLLGADQASGLLVATLSRSEGTGVLLRKGVATRNATSIAFSSTTRVRGGRRRLGAAAVAAQVRGHHGEVLVRSQREER